MNKKDPTTWWLDAAILDQKVAGQFHGLAYAYVPVMRREGKPWGLGIVVEGEYGYYAIESDSFGWTKRNDADDFCAGMNHHIGLDLNRMVEIIASSMRKPNKLRVTVEDV